MCFVCSAKAAIEAYSEVIDAAGDENAAQDCKAKALNNRALCYYKLVGFVLFGGRVTGR